MMTTMPMVPREPPDAPKGYRFRVATDADGPLANREFNRVFAMDRPLAGWRWKFEASAHGWWGVIAESDQGEFAGHYAMTWYPTRAGGRVAQAVDAFVAPEHQRRNLFARMGSFLLHGNARAGAVASFGLPNAAAIPGHQKVGWLFPRPLRLHARPLRPLRAVARAATASGAFQVVDAAAPPDAPLPHGARRVRSLAPFEDIIRAWDASRGALIPWDERSLSWRVLDRPDRTYDVVAHDDHACVLASAHLGALRAGVLLAALGATPAARRRACALAASAARATDHDVLVAASTAPGDRAAFLATGFLPTPRRLPWIRFDHAPATAAGAAAAREPWGLSLLEVDLF